MSATETKEATRNTGPGPYIKTNIQLDGTFEKEVDASIGRGAMMNQPKIDHNLKAKGTYKGNFDASIFSSGVREPENKASVTTINELVGGVEELKIGMKDLNKKVDKMLSKMRPGIVLPTLAALGCAAGLVAAIVKLKDDGNDEGLWGTMAAGMGLVGSLFVLAGAAKELWLTCTWQSLCCCCKKTKKDAPKDESSSLQADAKGNEDYGANTIGMNAGV